jgi:hypothetical protein
MRLITVAATALASLLALAGCTGGDRSTARSANAWALDAANPVGPPVDCVDRSRIRGHQARDDRTIDFSMTDGRLLRNRLPYGCPGLMRDNRFLYRSSTGRLCSTDTITLLDARAEPGASCGLGRFQEIALPPRPPARG